MKDQRGSVKVKSEKLYTQNEVDEILEKSEDSHYQESEKKKERRASVKRKRLNNNKVAKLVKRSNRILVTISSHALPFDLFPNIINIEEQRITIIDRHLFSSEVHSIDIKNISNILINNSFIFSEL